jgi:hypothetical protein
VLLAALLGAAAPGTAKAETAGVPEEAARQLAGIRERLGVDRAGLDDVATPRIAYGRRALEIEGWHVRPDGSRWPTDQSTFDIPSGRISKYVLFGNASTRQRGEAILPMGSVSPKGDSYLSLFMQGIPLELEGIERYRISGKESIYYELRYSPQPREVPFIMPLVKMLVDASTGRLYRFELAADFLGAPDGIPSPIVGGTSASTLAALHLGKERVAAITGGAATGEIWATDLYYVRPNGWPAASPPAGGQARLAWVVPFSLEGKNGRNILYVDARTGKIIGGLKSGS